MHKPFIITCIPAYNEEKSIAKVVLSAKKYVDGVIVCDDFSTDLTGEIAEGWAPFWLGMREDGLRRISYLALQKSL